MNAKGFFTAIAAFAITAGSFASWTSAADCPDKGSGFEGVEKWVEDNCGAGDCDDPATTCNGDFTIEFLGRSEEGNLVTFSYEICKNSGRDLSHWAVGLHGIDCFDEGLDLVDLLEAATLNGVPLRVRDEGDVKAQVTIGIDPTTQLNGIKFNVGVTAQCNIWSVTFDTSVLWPGYTLCQGCVPAATKAGNQDITRSDRPTPGYACITGPVCCLDTDCTNETAFAFGGDAAICFIEGGFERWGWTNGPLMEGEYFFDIYAGAGQCDLTKGERVGQLHVVYAEGVAVVTYQMDDGFTMSEAHLHIGCDPYPIAKNGRPTVAPGQYPYTATFVAPEDQHVFVTEVGSCDAGIYVIAHAVVCGDF